MMWLFAVYWIFFAALIMRIYHLEKQLLEIKNHCENAREALMQPELIKGNESGDILRELYKAIHDIEKKTHLR